MKNLFFLHVHQKLDDGKVQWVTADLFRADLSGKIVEHWDVIDAYPNTPNRFDPIFGDFHVTDMEQTEENKKQIRRFLVDILQNKEYATFEKYVANDLIQHNQEMAQGGKAYQAYLQEKQVTYDFVFKVMGQGNYVIAYSKAEIAGETYALFDIFRLENGKIVEHWDNKEIMPEKKALTNLGKF